jgi:hypothetical protein
MEIVKKRKKHETIEFFISSIFLCSAHIKSLSNRRIVELQIFVLKNGESCNQSPGNHSRRKFFLSRKKSSEKRK